MLRGKSPRSPVWLRKIPSTVSGSQGSRRGLRPAVRFAFPLGARLNITLRARPCQELFSESFCRPSRGPRGASPLGGLALRGDEFGIIRSPAAARSGNPPAHRMPTTPSRESGGGRRGFPAGGRHRPGASPRPIDIIAPGAQRFGSVRMRSRPAVPALAPAHRRGRLRSGARPTGARGRTVPAFGDTPEKEGRAPPEPARLTRGPPLGDRPWSILSASRRFRSFQYRYGLGTTRIRALKHFRRVRF